MRTTLCVMVAVACSLVELSGQDSIAKIVLQSTAFADGQLIPLTYSGYGDYKSPPRSWSGIPHKARELALILHDPDMPLDRSGVHWRLSENLIVCVFCVVCIF